MCPYCKTESALVKERDRYGLYISCRVGGWLKDLGVPSPDKILASDERSKGRRGMVFLPRNGRNPYFHLKRTRRERKRRKG